MVSNTNSYNIYIICRSNIVSPIISSYNGTILFYYWNHYLLNILIVPLVIGTPDKSYYYSNNQVYEYKTATIF